MFGIVTFHDGINFGTYLQAYALHKYLLTKNIFNEIIHYKNKRHWLNEYKFFLFTKNPFLLYSNIIKIGKFKKAQKKLLKTAFFNNTKTAQLKEYEGIIFGSDEIWNFMIPLVGRDLLYFGRGLKAKKFIAYAVSFGNLNQQSEIPDDIKKSISEFKSISVRDENSFEILQRFYKRQVVITIDPTLLYDFSSEEIECPENDFIMVYTTGFDKLIEKKIREYATALRMKLISVGYRNRFCDKNIVSIGPFEFLGYCKKAYQIITSMYHGVLFALKYKKDFCVVADHYRTHKMSILRVLNLESRIYSERDGFSIIFNKPIDYSSVETILFTEKKKSEEYLLNAINN